MEEMEQRFKVMEELLAASGIERESWGADREGKRRKKRRTESDTEENFAHPPPLGNCATCPKVARREARRHPSTETRRDKEATRITARLVGLPTFAIRVRSGIA
eukprot:COSAG02_NODE_2538_length_8577_cov_16.981835_7_plen_104_part_00